MNLTDAQRLRQRLHEEFGALEISPAPVLRVTGRGQGIRVRRRALAAGTAILATLAVVAATQFNGPAAAPSVTLNQPSPAAPGGVFASGTADGKPWALAVGNIAADPGTRWCLAAVMFNGRDGDVLFKAGRGAASFGSPALLPDISGFPGIGAVFTQVTPDVTRLVATYPDGRQVTVRPVQVRACGRSFRLAGYVVSDPLQGGGEIATYNRYGLDEALALANVGTSTSLFGLPSAPGIWSNLDKSRSDIAASHVAHPIGAGRVSRQIWHVRTSLGLFGQCYSATLRTPGYLGGQSSEQCVPVAAPPRTAVLDPVSIPGATTVLPGYAGLVSPRVAKVVVSVNNGTSLTVRPVNVAGRAYIAFAMPPGCQVNLVGLYDAAGHLFATTTPPPR